MMYRALLVFLVVVNVGVAAWWVLRTPPPSEDRIEMPAGVPRLQLLEELPAHQRPRVANVAAPATTPAPATTSAPTAVAPAIARAAATQCIAFGPYTNPALLRRAFERLQPQVAVARVRDVPRGTPRAWRVYMPPFPTREAAQAVADRMTAAGLVDLLVMPSGPDRNGIALGRFGNEDAARRHQANLQSKGFSAQVGPVGEGASDGWIDVAAAPAFDAARAARDVAAARTTPIACATLR